MSISRDVSDKDANSKLNHKIRTLSEKCYSTLEQNNALCVRINLVQNYTPTA